MFYQTKLLAAVLYLVGQHVVDAASPITQPTPTPTSGFQKVNKRQDTPTVTPTPSPATTTADQATITQTQWHRKDLEVFATKPERAWWVPLSELTDTFIGKHTYATMSVKYYEHVVKTKATTTVTRHYADAQYGTLDGGAVADYMVATGTVTPPGQSTGIPMAYVRTFPTGTLANPGAELEIDRMIKIAEGRETLATFDENHKPVSIEGLMMCPWTATDMANVAVVCQAIDQDGIDVAGAGESEFTMQVSAIQGKSDPGWIGKFLDDLWELEGVPSDATFIGGEDRQQ